LQTWREREGVEPTIPTEGPGSTDLKSEKPTRTHPLPKSTSTCHLTNYATASSKRLVKADFETAPTTWSTGLPLTKISNVGIPLIPYVVAVLGLLSTSTFANFTLPSNSLAKSSTMGAISLLPHPQK